MLALPITGNENALTNTSAIVFALTVLSRTRVTVLPSTSLKVTKRSVFPGPVNLVWNVKSKPASIAPR